METKQISSAEFTKDVNAGMTRKELMTKYSLTIANTNTVAKQLKLEIKRDIKPKFILIDDLIIEPVITNQLSMESLSA